MHNGITVAKFLTYISLWLEKQGDDIGLDFDQLQKLRVLNTDKAKTYNWTILAKQLLKINIPFEQEDLD